MAPKAANTKAPAAAPIHPPWKEMIKEAIANLKDRNGSSRPKLKQYIKSNYKGVDNDGFDRHFNAALKRGAESGEFVWRKGPSGTVKLGKKEPAPKAAAPKKAATAKKTTTAKKDTAKKETAKKETATKKETAPKKKATAATTATKKTTAAKPKANAKKPRKETDAAAPAVVDKPAVLTKTKSGRVSKGTTSTSKPAAKKKASTTTKKAAAPKKAAAAPKEKASAKKAAA